MNLSGHVSSYQENKQFLSRSYRSKEEFVEQYRMLYDDKSRAAELYFQILIELEKAIIECNIDCFKKLRNLIDSISEIEDQKTLNDFCTNPNNPIKSTNLVILACKYNNVEILKYLFDYNGTVSSNFSLGGTTVVLPQDEDEACHNAFYYAIRSSNVDILDTLIHKWPGDFFGLHLEELDEILSRAYEDIKIKNIQLSEEIEFFVENKLIDLRFFCAASKKPQSVKSNLRNIKERVRLVLENINLLTVEYSKGKGVNEKFLFVVRFVAQNIHILKRQLKSTYNRLPWEEMEFYIVSFVSSFMKPLDINLFYSAILSKDKILNYLGSFAESLENETNSLNNIDIGKAELPKLNREKVIAQVISYYPEFKELYDDYEQIRDIFSLEKISGCVNLAISANPKEWEGQLVIVRVLQVIGEYLKNTLESPYMSNTTSELLLLTLPKNTRKIIIDLRNSLSHANVYSERTGIEENMSSNIYSRIINDIKNVGEVVTDILYDYRIKMIKVLIEKIANTRNLDVLKEIAEKLNNVDLEEIASENFKLLGINKLEKLVKQLSDIVTEKTYYEKNLFTKINNIISSTMVKSESIKTDYIYGFIYLKFLTYQLSSNKIDHSLTENDIAIKLPSFCQETLNGFQQTEYYKLKEIAELSMKISYSAASRMHHKFDEVARLCMEILYVTNFETSDVKWINELRIKLNNECSVIPTHKERMTCNVTEKKCNEQLAKKLSELKSVLGCNKLTSKSTESFLHYKSNNKMQAAVEMLVLDIMSILGSSRNRLENNLLFLDNIIPVLTGKCLRNYIAHDSALIKILLPNPSLAIILNAEKLLSKNVMENQLKIGKIVKDNPFRLKEKYCQTLHIITNQERMFTALEKGNLEDFKSCLNKGADVNARNINSWTSLHFAAKGPSLELVKFILDQNLDINAKDIYGQTPFHIAAAYGRKYILEFLVKKVDFCVDDQDKKHKTPLHLAAQNGHKDVVEFLINSKANISLQDLIGYSPLHYAILNNHVDVAKILLDKEVHVDINEAMGGFTSLHIAAENGHLELVNFLLVNGANVNTRNDRKGTPLHIAALNGHLKVVSALISNGADVNARVIDGLTPLHNAVKIGDKKITNILLKHGANVNVGDKKCNNTPLHYAARYGHEEIVKALLISKANINISSVDGKTPLHLAGQGGYLNIVSTLLKHGFNIHAKDKSNATVLHYAAENDHRAIAELLIENGESVNARTIRGLTPLHLAAMRGNLDMADLLFRSNAEVKTRDILGYTPLHLASKNGCNDIIDLLIKNKAEINARANDGLTPLHLATQNGHEDSVALLIKYNADINAKTNLDFTPLHTAVMAGHKHIVYFLIQNGAYINAGNVTPLHIAIEAGQKEVIEVLIANGANVNLQSKNLTPLLAAIKCNNKEVVETLIANGANVNAENNTHLQLAVFAGNRDIVEILLQNKANVNIRSSEKLTPLHVAARRGDVKIVNALITRGADVDAVNINNVTPLFLASKEGQAEVVKVLIENGASVNVKSAEGYTPLHSAVENGHINVIKVLLDNNINVSVKDKQNRTSLEMAVAHGHLQVVKVLLQYQKGDMNTKGNGDWTILHIASQENNLEMVEYLVNEGCDINARNALHSMPIHIAAREGHKDTVEFLLSKGSSINDLGTDNQTLLHYAAMKGRLNVVEYLITQGADVNAKDDKGLTPMHIASYLGHKNVIEVLLENGAVYNVLDKSNKKPSEIARAKCVIDLLSSTEKLFEAVKCNSFSDVEKCLKVGAFVNAKSNIGAMPLHYAAWKGYDEIVNILVKYKANPNTVCNKGYTPLHYAAKFSHLKIVKALLSNGAVYNAVSNSGKTPMDFAVDKSIAKLFKLLSESFKKIENGNSNVINDLNRIKDIDTVKVIMNARNRENRTLVVAAVHSNFSKTEELKQISQPGISTQINRALILLSEDKYEEGLNILRSIFLKRKEILGADNPGTLDIQTYMARALIAQGCYVEALNMCEEIFQKQKGTVGLNDKDTLNTRSLIAFVLHKQGKDEEALGIFQEVYQKQKEIIGPNHSDTLDTHFHMALVLDRLERYKEALDVNKAIFKIRKRTLGANDPATIRAQNNIAMVLLNKGEYDKAYEIYKEVYDKKKTIFGIFHSDTLRTLQSMAGTLCNQKKYVDSMKVYQELLNIQKNVFGENHPETLTTKYNMANAFLLQNKCITALKAYNECFDKIKSVFGPFHPFVFDILQKIKLINTGLEFEGSNISDILQHLKNDINNAASNGDIQTVRRLLDDGADVNDKDVDGRTPLHYAVSSGHVGVVKFLLDNGADVTQITNKGNTPLHTATSKSYKEVIVILLQHVRGDKLCDFINAKTYSSGTTSLHIAAKNGSLEIVKVLLKHGASYNTENKEGKTALDFSREQNVIDMLKLVEELFEDSKKGSVEIISKLKAMKQDEFLAATNARNNQGSTLLQVAMVNKHKDVSRKLLDMLKLESSNASDILKHLQKDINIAACNGDIQTVRCLLEDGADVNDKDLDGRTPLHFAVNSGHVGVVKLLLNNGADVTLVTNKGNTPLHTAASKSYKEIIVILLQHVTDDKLNDFINAKTFSSGTTSLHISAKNGSLDIVKVLLKHGASYNTENKEGKTALDFSREQNVIDLLKLVEELFEDSMKGSVEIISKLKVLKQEEFLAVTNARNNQGNTLLQVAIVNKHKDVSRKLLEILKLSNQN